MSTGGCICGAIRYSFSDEPIEKALCYCRACQQLTGSAFSTNILVPESSFKITKGTPKRHKTKQDGGIILDYSFCATCACRLFVTADSQKFTGVVIVQAGSLDDVDGDHTGLETYEPDSEVWVHKRVSWLQRLEGKAQLRDFPDASVGN